MSEEHTIEANFEVKAQTDVAARNMLAASVQDAVTNRMAAMLRGGQYGINPLADAAAKHRAIEHYALTLEMLRSLAELGVDIKVK